MSVALADEREDDEKRIARSQRQAETDRKHRASDKRKLITRQKFDNDKHDRS